MRLEKVWIETFWKLLSYKDETVEKSRKRVVNVTSSNILFKECNLEDEGDPEDNQVSEFI